MNGRAAKIAKRANDIVIGIVAIFSALILVFDFFSEPNQIPFIGSFDYSKAILLLLALLSIHLVIRSLSNQHFETSFPDEIQRLIESLDGVEIRTFSDAAEMEDYIAKRILEAKVKVDDLSWKNTIGPSFALGKRKKSHQSYERNISKISKTIVFREIFVFNDLRRIEKLERRLKENFPGYSCRYFPEIETIPRLQFVLVDSEEIIFASSSYPQLCAIKHPSLAAIFQAFYDEAWSRSTPIMDGTIIHEETVKEIRAKSKTS